MLHDLAVYPGERICLVGQPELDVLDVASDARVCNAVLDRELPCEIDGVGDALLETGSSEAGLDSDEELADGGLGRVRPFG